MKNLTYILPLVLTLSACGGGGGGGSGGGGSSDGGSATAPSTPPVTGTPSTGSPSTGTPSTDTPSTGSPSTGTPSTDTPSTGTPSTDTPSTGTPSTDTPSTGTPSTGTPSTGTPSTGTPSTGTPSTGTPSTGTPSTGTPSTGTPSTGTPSTGSPNTIVQLDKYVGTHLSNCVVGSRQRATFARTGSDSLALALSLDLYANASCTGAVIGTVSFSAPAVLTYTDTRSATYYLLPGSVSSSTQTVDASLDHFVVTAPATQAVVTGSGVTVGTVDGHREACVSFNYTTPMCKNIDEWIPAYTVQQGLSLIGNTLYVGNAPDTSQPDPYNTWYRVNVLYTKQ